MLTQREKAKDFYDLHHSGKLLILPNIWDCLGALLLEDIGYPAVATASASVAFSNGYDDGEHIPFNELLLLLKKITGSVNIPVSADIETGFAENNNQLKESIEQLVETGIVGINIEDTDKNTRALLRVEKQCERIKIIKEACKESGSPLFINARTDVYLHGDPAGNKPQETIERGLAYKDAGADCFYPITMHNAEEISSLVKAIQMPVNILLMPGTPSLNELEAMGVARVSLGPFYLKTAVRAMKDLALKLKDHEDIDEIKTNEITSLYLKSLVNKHN